MTLQKGGIVSNAIDFVPDITGTITVFDIQFNCLVNQMDMVWNMIELSPTGPPLQLIILVFEINLIRLIINGTFIQMQFIPLRLVIKLLIR